MKGGDGKQGVVRDGDALVDQQADRARKGQEGPSDDSGQCGDRQVDGYDRWRTRVDNFPEVLSSAPTACMPREIRTPAHGAGLDGVLQHVPLTGILNGIDVEEWDPLTDPYLPNAFDADTLNTNSEDRNERFSLLLSLWMPGSPTVLERLSLRTTRERRELPCLDACLAASERTAPIGWCRRVGWPSASSAMLR